MIRKPMHTTVSNHICAPSRRRIETCMQTTRLRTPNCGEHPPALRALLI
jgi:hypothetical protein